ncbi:hypothetical protein L1987_33782 [Smallanthus sonchifolius]|uniref:Uncharacterized protein n=1 Tax=Smallanthus sonchifolius TaxID=185202 RepID=A0ACB9HTC7_9ASTR|nr:hypothetical protein L1987_33782 [Smallanthus sonchifolius]
MEMVAVEGEDRGLCRGELYERKDGMTWRVMIAHANVRQGKTPCATTGISGMLPQAYMQDRVVFLRFRCASHLAGLPNWYMGIGKCHEYYEKNPKDTNDMDLKEWLRSPIVAVKARARQGRSLGKLGMLCRVSEHKNDMNQKEWLRSPLAAIKA